MAGYSASQSAAEIAAQAALSAFEVAPPLPVKAAVHDSRTADTAAKFQPDYTPEQLEGLGVYDSLYRGQGPRLASLGEWKPEWVSEHDPKGWAQWYKRYSSGRRIPEEDDRQIKRWASFKARHGSSFTKNPTPRRGWALRNWGIDPAKMVPNEARNGVVEMLEEYQRKAMQKHVAEKQADLLPEVQLQEHQQRIQDTVDDENPRMIVYHGLGSGKSLSALAAAEAAKQKYNEDYGIVAPASLKGNFQKEVEKFTTGSKPEILSYTGMGLGKKFTNQPQTVIMDEAHRLRNPGGAAAQAAAEAASNAKRLLLLTGSPITNSPSDLANLISLVTKKPISPQDFEKRYIGQKTVYPNLINYLAGIKPGVQPVIRNEDELKSMLKGHVDYQPSKTPEGVNVNEEKIQVPLTAPQQKIQKALRTKIPPGFLWKLDQEFPLGKDELSKLNSFLTGLRQNSVSTRPFRVDNDAFKAFEQSGKLQEAYKRLSQMLESDPRKKAIIYSNHIGAGVEPYAAALAANNIPHGIFHGGVPTRQRQQALADYNAGKLRALLIGPAGAEGLSTKGTNLIQLLDPHWHESRSQQARGRGLRFDSHDDLPEELKNVAVQRFISKSEEPSFLGKLMGYRRERTGDEILERLSNEKEKINERFRQLLREVGTQPKTAAQKFGYELGNRPESTNTETGYSPPQPADLQHLMSPPPFPRVGQIIFNTLDQAFTGDKSLLNYFDSAQRLRNTQREFAKRYNANLDSADAATAELGRMHRLAGTTQHNKHTHAVDRAVVDLNAAKATAPNPIQTSVANFGPKPELPPISTAKNSPVFDKIPGPAVKPQAPQPKPPPLPIKTSATSPTTREHFSTLADGSKIYRQNMRREPSEDGLVEQLVADFVDEQGNSVPDVLLQGAQLQPNIIKKFAHLNADLVAFGNATPIGEEKDDSAEEQQSNSKLSPSLQALGLGGAGALSGFLLSKYLTDNGYSLRHLLQQNKTAGTPAWQRSAGKNEEGGLNAKGRASYNKATGGNLKAPVTESNPDGERAKRQNSFCSRMCGMKRVNTGAKTKSDPDSRINKSLRKWNCKCGSVNPALEAFGKDAGFRWYKRFPMTENLALNLSLGGPSLTVKKIIPGTSFTLGKRAPRMYVGTPIPGLAYQQYLSPKKHKIKAEKEFKDEPPEVDKDDQRNSLEKVKDFLFGSEYDTADTQDD